MKRLFTFVTVLFMSASSLLAGTGIFQTYVILDIGGGTIYRAGGNNADNAVTYTSMTNLGTHISGGSTLTLKGGEMKTWKNSGGDVTGARLYYRVYETGQTPGSFILVNLPWAQNINGSGDQRWTNSGANINLLTGTSASKTYTVELYWQATTNEGDRYDTNSSNNYKREFITDAPLAANFSSLTAQKAQNQNALTWATASEANIANYAVERSRDSRNWEIIGNVAAKNATNGADYSFNDNKVVAGTTYYRIRIEEYSGAVTYSKVVSVKSGFGTLSAYPNPVKSVLTIETDSYTEGGMFEVVDIAGRTVLQQNMGNQLDVSALNAGVYQLKMISKAGQTLQQVRFVKE